MEEKARISKGVLEIVIYDNTNSFNVVVCDLLRGEEPIGRYHQTSRRVKETTSQN